MTLGDLCHFIRGCLHGTCRGVPRTVHHPTPTGAAQKMKFVENALIARRGLAPASAPPARAHALVGVAWAGVGRPRRRRQASAAAESERRAGGAGAACAALRRAAAFRHTLTQNQDLCAYGINLPANLFNFTQNSSTKPTLPLYAILRLLV